MIPDENYWAANAPGLTNSSPLETIQTVLDQLLPGNSELNTEFDNSMIEFSDLKLSLIGSLKWSVNKMVQLLKPRRTLRPRLRTSCAPPRQATTTQALLSLNKRNLGANHVAAPASYTDFAEQAFEHMMDVFAVSNWRQRLAKMDKIVPNEKDALTWLQFQNPSTIRALEKMDPAYVLQYVKEHISDYEFILKSEPKVATDTKPQTNYATVQTVMFHKKEVNAFFGPMIREADIRFRSLLRPEVLYNKGKNLDQIEEFLNQAYMPAMGNVIVENDFSDYDRSQEKVAFALDKVMLSKLGLNAEDLDTWMAGHYRSTNFAYSLGLVVYLQYQRKSGDVTTAFGNTVLNMTALAWSLKLKAHEVICAMFLGDDSWFQLMDSPSLRGRIKECSTQIALNFNGDAKTAYFDRGYFCGYYILEVDGRVYMAADPVKRAVKLGRWDIKDSSLIHENWVSFKDLMRNYDKELVQEELAKAVLERLPPSKRGAVKPLIESLNTLRLSYKEFANLWEQDISTTVY